MHQGTKHITTFRGHELPVVELARIAGMQRSTLLNRYKMGWDLDAAVVATAADKVNHKTSALWAKQPQVKRKADEIERAVVAFFKRLSKKSKMKYTARKSKQTVLDVPVVANVEPSSVESLIQILIKEVQALKK